MITTMVRDLTKTDLETERLTQRQIIGQRIPKYDAFGKATGKTIYGADFRLPGMVYAQVKRSEVPCAAIDVDIKEAEKVPGVVAIMVAKDVPQNVIISRFGHVRTTGAFEGTLRILADGDVRYQGEPIALVAAVDLEVAKKAVERIRVEYEQRKGVYDPEEALRPGAHIVGGSGSNLICKFEIKKGDIEKGFQEADLVVKNEYRTSWQEHAYLELDAGLAWADEDGFINIRTGTQVLEHFRTIAQVLNLPQNRVRTHNIMVGGGFGGREDITEEIYTALLAWKTRRPVKLVYERKEMAGGTSKRHPFIIRLETGVKRTGELVAVKAELIQDAGAYVTLSPWVLFGAAIVVSGPYLVPNVYIDAVSSLTNNPIGGAFRSFGASQACFACESQIDEIARRLEMDPLVLREINYLKTGDRNATNQVVRGKVDLPEASRRAWETLGNPEKHDEDFLVGRGLAVGMTSTGRPLQSHDTSRSYVGFELDGTVTIRCGAQDVGGGQLASLAQIAAQVLGVRVEDVTVLPPDSLGVPLAGSTTSTRQLFMSGNATLKASQQLKTRLLVKASEMLGVPLEHLEMDDGKVISIQDRARSITLKDLIAAANIDGIELFVLAQFNASWEAEELFDFEKGEGATYPDFTYGAVATEVKVSKITGRVFVTKGATCFDVGRAINPGRVEGQMEGGFAMGLGITLTEDFQVKQGHILTPTLMEYLIPTSMDVPDVKSIILESRSGLGPFGAKGIGEPCITPVGGAIINAVYDATGIRFRSMPLTPEKVLLALRGQKTKITGEFS